MYIYLHASGCCNCLTAHTTHTHIHTRSTSHQSILLCRCLFVFRVFRGSKSCFEVFRQATVQSIYRKRLVLTVVSHFTPISPIHTCQKHPIRARIACTAKEGALARNFRRLVGYRLYTQQCSQNSRLIIQCTSALHTR